MDRLCVAGDLFLPTLPHPSWWPASWSQYGVRVWVRLYTPGFVGLKADGTIVIVECDTVDHARTCHGLVLQRNGWERQ